MFRTRRALTLAAVISCVAAAVDAQHEGSAWLVRSLENAADRREWRSGVLDTPILPGSVMKAVALVAALEHHAIQADTAHFCRRIAIVRGRKYVCSHPDLQRPISAAEALAHSCNNFFVSLAPRLSMTAFNDVRVAVGLPPVPPGADATAAILGLDGPRVSPRALLDVFASLTATDPKVMKQSTRRVLLEGLRGAATYGSASELASRGISALAKTGTSVMPAGGQLGVLIALVPAERPSRAIVVVAPGAAGRDAVSIAADLLSAERRVRVGTIDAAGRAQVETMPLEAYVARVVAGEGVAGSPKAALEALAIAARTVALAHGDRHGREGYDLCDTTHCQALRPATRESTQAAAATVGRVLVHGNRTATVFYSASCGGRSELAASVWPGASNDPAVEGGRQDEACAGEPAWTSELAAAEIERVLRAAGMKGDRLRDLDVAGRTASGRVAGLRAPGFSPAEISGEEFRISVGRTLGWQRLKSTAFQMRRTAGGYLFAGRGSGHGVGMCVLGAFRRAAHGAPAEDILRFYYPGLRVDSTGSESGSVEGSTDVRLALPGAEEGERARVTRLVRGARDEIAERAGVAAPPAIRVTVHPNTESFGRAAGQPWWVSGATAGAAIDLLPITILKRRGQLERTIRHEVAHAVLDDALKARPMWVREGAALYFASGSKPSASISGSCPADEELRRPASRQAQRDAYARAEACFREQIAAGRNWRDVR